jgi:hypothetical protein
MLLSRNESDIHLLPYTLYIYPLHIHLAYTLSIYYITYTIYIYPLHIHLAYTLSIYYITYTIYIYPLHIHLAYTTTHIPHHIYISHIPYTRTFHLSRYISIYTRRSRTFNNYPNIAKLYIEN